jgi:hypothetical protein
MKTLKYSKFDSFFDIKSTISCSELANKNGILFDNAHAFTFESGDNIPCTT